MRIYRLPERLSLLIFDVDNTLYRNQGFVESQTRLLIERLARETGTGTEEARRSVDAARAAYRREHNGESTSLGNLMSGLGVSIETSVRWREELFEPSEWLEPDPVLRSALERLGEQFLMCCVTNNPSLVGRKTLQTLGIEGCFEEVIGLDTCLVSKPSKEPFQRALTMMKCPAAESVSIGDRFEVDLSVPLAMGMGGILVESMEDVYRLPDVLTEGVAQGKS